MLSCILSCTFYSSICHLKIISAHNMPNHTSNHFFATCIFTSGLWSRVIGVMIYRPIIVSSFKLSSVAACLPQLVSVHSSHWCSSQSLPAIRCIFRDSFFQSICLMLQHLDFFFASSKLVCKKFFTILLHFEKIAIVACKGIINIICTYPTIRN